MSFVAQFLTTVVHIKDSQYASHLQFSFAMQLTTTMSLDDEVIAITNYIILLMLLSLQDTH